LFATSASRPKFKVLETRPVHGHPVIVLSNFHHDDERPWSGADRLLAAQSVVLLIFSSWALGGRMAWGPPAILAVACLGLPALWLRHRERGGLKWRAFVPLLLWSALVGIGLYNPSGIPSAAHGEYARAGWASWLPTTVARDATKAAMLPWLAALLQGGMIAAVRPERRVVRFIWGAAAFNGFALAVVGAGFHFAEARKLLGMVTALEPEYFFATFFYKNHWAAYGALSAIAGLALALRVWKATVRGDPRARGRFVLFSGISLLTAITLPLPGSRSGAFMALLILTGFLACLIGSLWRARGRSGRQPWLIALVAGGIVFGAMSYGTQLYARRSLDLERTRRQISGALEGGALDLRFLVTRDTWHMAETRPWFGWGMGSFKFVFPSFQGNYLRGPGGILLARFDFAHDDWMQMMAEAGICGLAILVLPVLSAAWGAWRKGGVGGRWGISGCAMIAAYAWVDFPLNNPAVLMLWTVLLLTARDLGSGSAGDASPERRRTRE
jgi:O-antigen ligase